MCNIFTTENVAKYNTKPRYVGVGEYVLRNGIWAMDIRPEPFYKNYGDESYILRNEFIANTQYIIDLWIDGDDCIYDGVCRPCGLRLYYTDGTYNDSAVITGASNKGFQHVQYVTDKSKSVRDFDAYYWTSTPVYYRADSRVIPLSNQSNINKQGIAQSTEMTEYINGLDNSKIGKGYMLSNQFYEL
jgi:hypothetical protein